MMFICELDLNISITELRLMNLTYIGSHDMDLKGGQTCEICERESQVKIDVTSWRSWRCYIVNMARHMKNVTVNHIILD